MKIKLYCDSGANIHSERSEVIDLEKDWGITDEEWESMSDQEKEKLCNEWAYNRLEIGWTPVDDK
jgi:hypothetical protein